MIVLEETEGVKITPDSESLEVTPGSLFSFTVETDNRFGDAKMEVFANTTKLNAGTDNRYTITVNANTMIHANFVQPQPTTRISSWKLTDSRGGVGLVTDVINVISGKTFTIRANALAIPQDDASMFYAAVLTDANGAIKEFISPVFTNSGTNYGDLPCSFSCQVKEASVREGNLVRVATSYNKKEWHLVKGINENVKDSIKAVGNEVLYHKITMPSSVQGATIQGAIDQIVHGMDFTCKIMPVSVADAVTVSINGKIVADRQGVAQIKVESVREDLDITIQVVAAGDETYTAINLNAGELASKTSLAFPSRLKLIGEMNAADFKTLQDNAAKLVALDLTDVTIKSSPTPNSLPTNAFTSSNPTKATALSTILLPKNLKSIEASAFYRCMNIKEITIPETVTHIGSGAFATCIKLEKIVALSKTPVQLKSNPFPMNSANITLEVPQGTESAYANSEFWKELQHTTSKVFYNIQIDPDRTFQYSAREPLAKIEGPVGSATKTVMLGLPNFKPTSYKPNPIYRPEAAFKLYDNKQDVTAQLAPLDPSAFNPGGYYQVKFYGYVTDPQYLTCPQNHTIDVVFHYEIKFKDASGKSKINFVALNEANVWKDVNMSLFIEGSKDHKTLYKEGCDYKFTVVSETPSMTPKVKIASEVVLPDENGIYVITNLQSDMEVEITMVPVEDAVLKPEEVIHINKEEADGIVELGLSGEMTDTAFEHIRENFTSLETIDMSAIENSEIPSNAFAGMENLTNVVIPGNVTSIGKNAFAGCSQLESLTLNSVDAIDAGALTDVLR